MTCTIPIGTIVRIPSHHVSARVTGYSPTGLVQCTAVNGSRYELASEDVRVDPAQEQGPAVSRLHWGPERQEDAWTNDPTTGQPHHLMATPSLIDEIHGRDHGLSYEDVEGPSDHVPCECNPDMGPGPGSYL